MTKEKDRKYCIRKTGDVLVFSTSSFSDDTASVLHSGIYNREFASALASLAVAGIVYMALAMNLRKTAAFNIAVIAVIIVGFPFFRKFVFKEKYLETAFDIAKGKAEIFLVGFQKKQKESIALPEIEQLLIESRKRKIENPDGVEFVEKISLQHGMVIPGFGEETVMFLLKLKLTDGSDRTIYADTDMQDVINAHGEITDFLKINILRG